jgi:hypothetical protein
MTSTIQGRSHSSKPTTAVRQPVEEREAPGPPASATVRLRNTFTLTSRRSAGGREHHLITAPRRGPARGQARRAILAVLRRAEQRQDRVWFLITFGDYSRLPLGFNSGYEAGAVLTQCRAKQDDPYVWFQDQFQRHHQPADAHAIIGVEIATWPSGGTAGTSRH